MNDKINLKYVGFKTHSHPVTYGMDRRWQHYRHGDTVGTMPSAVYFH